MRSSIRVKTHTHTDKRHTHTDKRHTQTNDTHTHTHTHTRTRTRTRTQLGKWYLLGSLCFSAHCPTFEPLYDFHDLKS